MKILNGAMNIVGLITLETFLVQATIHLQYLALYMPTHVSAGVSGNKSLPDPIPYPLFLETIKGSRYSA